MIYSDLYKQFNEQFWNFFLNSELARNRKALTWNAWLNRTRVARKVMFRYLEEHGTPKENPFFWAKRFPEPVPTDYNGSPDLNRTAPTTSQGCNRLYVRQLEDVTRSTPVTADEIAQRNRFSAIARAVNACRKNITTIAQDVAAFNAQKDEPNGYKTLRQYLWYQCAENING